MGISEAGTSSGSVYQVFLSFRGPDTRHGFTDFLYHSLIDAGIYVFRDDEELRVGEKIDGALQRAIDDSRIYIPIFSRTYTSSHWCLRELRQIVDNTSKSNGNKEILHIFFDVEPDDVKLKTPLYEAAILNLECEKKLSIEQVDSWREALKEVGAIKGWEAKKYNGQGELIKLVVEEVVKKLKTKQKSVTEHLIGINDQVVAVKKLLDVSSGGGRLIQIHGMGGIGKTTLAKVLFNQLSTHFGKCCCFLEDVREKSSRTDGLVELQKKLLSEIGNATGTGSIDATDYGMKRIEETLRLKKVFIVLDDVDKSEQVENLVGKGTLCSGSRVLITTRNEDVLQIAKPEYDILPYEMKVMSSDHALQLFSRHAFNKDSPPYDRDDISKEIVSATGSLPLTIAVIGSLLNHETQDLWKETLDDLRKAPPEGVFEKLRISYNALTLRQQQIFLDIACFFIGETMTNPIYMWIDCGFSPFRGIEVLKNKSLIKIGNDNEFLMHDQLRDLGREIVRQENQTIPGGRSRLWIRDEVLITMKIEEMKKVQAMEVTHTSIKSEEIGRFKELRFLRLDDGTFDGDLMDCFPELKWIYLSDSSFSECKLTNMCLKNVVVLEFSSVPSIDDQKLFQFIKGAIKLKVLSLANCHGITRTPDLYECSKLERLTFLACDGLTKIDGSIGKLKYLKDLKFDLCNRLEGLPEKMGDLRNLEHFSLQYCRVMKELPDFIFKWKSLRELQLSIARPMELLGAIGKFENLKALQVEGNLKSQLPYEIGLLLRLQILELKGFDEIRELPDLSNLTNLVRLKLSDGSKIDGQDRTYTGDLEWIRGLSKLKKLSLCLLHVPAPTELASLTRLDKLRLCGLNLQPLKQLPSSLLELTLDNFNSITFLSSHLENLSKLRLICSQMQEIILDGLQLPNLMKLRILDCGPLERFMLSSMTKLEKVTVDDCPKLDEIHIAGVLESLHTLDICNWKSFRRFVYVDRHWESSHESSLVLASRVFNKLWRLCIQFCDKILGIQVVGMSESLQDLTVSGYHLQSLGGLSELKNLECLCIESNPELRIVEGLNKLEFLKLLYLRDCPLLESPIDVSTTELPNDCYLRIASCPKLLGFKQGFEGSVQDFKQYKEEEIVPAALADPLVGHQLMVSNAESSAQLQMRIPGEMNELPSPFEQQLRRQLERWRQQRQWQRQRWPQQLQQRQRWPQQLQQRQLQLRLRRRRRGSGGICRCGSCGSGDNDSCDRQRLVLQNSTAGSSWSCRTRWGA
ncbi:disease resistance protein RPV1-like isoform X2 [Eucalyptus grandis]|uniref:disease resistance protein RPV1-like isoform X2 n=1 Tax=Eucalyptus grandis TaxID=71139 RepID=UPI00192EDF61|nr:disease resistance protein RPV1-like isoform X2 [Eucalyptus grandis]